MKTDEVVKYGINIFCISLRFPLCILCNGDLSSIAYGRIPQEDGIGMRILVAFK